MYVYTHIKCTSRRFVLNQALQGELLVIAKRLRKEVGVYKEDRASGIRRYSHGP